MWVFLGGLSGFCCGGGGDGSAENTAGDQPFRVSKSITQY